MHRSWGKLHYDSQAKQHMLHTGGQATACDAGNSKQHPLSNMTSSVWV